MTSPGATVIEAPASRRLQLVVVRDYGIVVAFVALFVVLSLASDVFLTKQNLINITFQAAPIGIMAAGATLVFIAGGFDLSVGAISAFAGIIAAKTFQSTGLGLWPSLVIGALVGLGLGVGNGVVTTVGRINAFIATLASSIIIRGVAIAVTGGFLVSIDDESFGTLGLGEVAGVEYPIFVWLGFALFCGLLLSRMTFGRYVYAAGGNPEAARLSGVRVGLVRGTCFAISGLSAGIAGVILASQVGTAQADANPLIEFEVITAVVLGGVSILGGEGAVWRSVVGALFLQMIGNGFNLLNVTPVYQQVFKGTILLAAVGLDAWVRRRRT